MGYYLLIYIDKDCIIKKIITWKGDI